MPEAGESVELAFLLAVRFEGFLVRLAAGFFRFFAPPLALDASEASDVCVSFNWVRRVVRVVDLSLPSTGEAGVGPSDVASVGEAGDPNVF